MYLEVSLKSIFNEIENQKVLPICLQNCLQNCPQKIIPKIVPKIVTKIFLNIFPKIVQKKCPEKIGPNVENKWKKIIQFGIKSCTNMPFL
jgi:hypothetical protein